MGQEMMTYRDRLRALQMSVSRNWISGMFVGLGKKGSHDYFKSFSELGAGILQKKPHVRCNLIVATSPGMQFCSGRSLCKKGLLEIHVHVLEFSVPFK